MIFKRPARGRHRPRHRPGEMNKLEQEYCGVLEARKLAGEILEFWFEPMKLRLAKNTSYTVDFMVLTKASDLECHEVKGFWEEDAKVKIKVAAELFPFRFIALEKRKKDDPMRLMEPWKIVEF